MRRAPSISAAQFFGTAFGCRAALTIALNGRWAAGENLLDGAFSCLGAMGLGLLLALPAGVLFRRCPDQPIGEQAVQLFEQGGKAVSLCYLAYFLVMNGVSLGLFQLFLQDNVPLDFPAFLILAAAVGAALYGAWRGLETVARAGSCVLVLLLLGTALVFALACRRFRWENLQPPLENGLSPLAGGAAVFLSRTTLFGEMAVLLPFVRGRRGLGFTLWAGGTSLFVGVLVALLAGCLGPYAATQNFPVYALASLTEITSLQRLDGVFTGVWMMGLTIQTAVSLSACRVCAMSLQRGRETLWMAGAAVAMLVLGGAAAQAPAAQSLFLDTGLWLGLTVLTGAGLPLLVLAVKRFKAKRRRRP